MTPEESAYLVSELQRTRTKRRTDNMNVTKPTIPRKVAEAIERLREIGVTDFGIVKFVGRRLPPGHARLKPHMHVIDEWLTKDITDRDVLLTALVNGYEIEKAPEEQLRMYIDDIHVSQMKAETPAQGRYYAGICRGVVKTLDILGIKIEGVND